MFRHFRPDCPNGAKAAASARSRSTASWKAIQFSRPAGSGAWMAAQARRPCRRRLPADGSASPPAARCGRPGSPGIWRAVHETSAYRRCSPVPRKEACEQPDPVQHGISEQPIGGDVLHHDVSRASPTGQEGGAGQHAGTPDRLAIPKGVEQCAGPHPAFVVECRSAQEKPTFGREYAAPGTGVSKVQ